MDRLVFSPMRLTLKLRRLTPKRHSFCYFYPSKQTRTYLSQIIQKILEKIKRKRRMN